METRIGCVVVLFLVFSTGCAGQGAESPVETSGDYLGQEPPGMTAQLFGSGLLSTGANELNCAVSPDGSMVVFSEWHEGMNTLMAITRTGNGWGDRVVLPFSGVSGDVDPVFSADGTRLYFSSKRPRDDHDQQADSDLWYVERTTDGGWGEPSLLADVNSAEMDEYYTSIASDGALYFSVFPEHGSPGDIYRADPLGDGYAAPELVGEPVSTEYSEHDPFISPDGSYLIFTSDRPGGHGRGDLWVVFRTTDGGWSEALNMGPEINTPGYDYCAMLSPDGRYLFLTRNAGGNGDIYWVDAAVIDRLRDGLS
jgi:Tol biopolymer transport system component